MSEETLIKKDMDHFGQSVLDVARKSDKTYFVLKIDKTVDLVGNDSARLISEIASLLYSAFPDSTMHECFLTELNVLQYWIVCLDNENRVIGFRAVKRIHDKFKGRQLVVHSDYRALGIGKNLISTLNSYLFTNNITDKVYGASTEANALKLHASCGAIIFKISLGDLTYGMNEEIRADIFSRIVMDKKLNKWRFNKSVHYVYRKKDLKKARLFNDLKFVDEDEIEPFSCEQFHIICRCGVNEILHPTEFQDKYLDKKTSHFTCPECKSDLGSISEYHKAQCSIVLKTVIEANES